MTTDFVEGWSIVQLLGEGAYGAVKLLMNKANNDLVAMKVVNFGSFRKAKKLTEREILIHRKLDHPSVIKFHGYRLHKLQYYLFLEFARHGELFDLIEPDVGMSFSSAQRYIRQLCAGVEYIHSQGIVHRDLKPENLLLDVNYDLKISDFGLSTVFRLNGKYRLLHETCGTPPYSPPEMYVTSHAAEPVDVWSIGVILAVLLSGELPWDSPVDTDEAFRAWKLGNITNKSPWNRISADSLKFIKSLLICDPSYRITLKEIQAHPWFGIHHVDEPEKKKANDFREVAVQSQPLQRAYSWTDVLSNILPRGSVAFSQPTQPSNMILSTQGFTSTESSSSNEPNRWQNLVKRFTRILLNLGPEKACTELTLALNNLGLSWKIQAAGIVTVETNDRRKNILIFRVLIVSMEPGNTLLSFHLLRGCGLDFKRLFRSVRSQLSQLATLA